MKKISMTLLALALLLSTANSSSAYLLAGPSEGMFTSAYPSFTVLTYSDTSPYKDVPGSLSLQFSAGTGQRGLLLLSGVANTIAVFSGPFFDRSASTYTVMDTDITPGVFRFAVNYNPAGVYSLAFGLAANGVFRLSEIQLSKTDPPPTPTPLPAAMWLLGSGLAGLAAMRKKFKAS